MEQAPLSTNEYTDDSGVKYLFEYNHCDSFDHLPQNKIRQCWAIAWNQDKFIVVNDIENPGTYTLVGGTVEPGEHPDDTLKREIQEESNMRVLKYRPIGYQKVITADGAEEPYYQLRYFAIIEPYGPFVADPAGKVTEITECDETDYTKYFNWGEIGELIVNRALKFKRQYDSTK